jgi:hypothetical protein
MSKYFFWLALLAGFCAVLQADVPQMIHYQGRALVGNTNFNGVGQFKFALVSDGRLISSQATAMPIVFNGFLVGFNVTSGGSGYTSSPSVMIADTSGSGALATANVSNGMVVSITVNSPGFGYSQTPSVVIAPASSNLSYMTFWSNDGTSVGGNEPSGAVLLNVNKGVYSVLLGSTAFSNMLSVPKVTFTNSDVRLRVWFNDGSSGFQQLSPDQRLVSMGYAMIAGNVDDNAITTSKLSDGAVTGAKLAPNAVTSSNIAAGSINGSHIGNGAIGTTQIAAGSIDNSKLSSGAALANLMQNGQAAVAAGGIILSDIKNATNLLFLGYAEIGQVNLTPKEWKFLNDSRPLDKNAATAVWTGNELIYYGGQEVGTGLPLSTGFRYNPFSNTVVTLPTVGAPARYNHTATWIGSDMVVWGGYDGTQNTEQGSRYNVKSNRWFNLPTSGLGVRQGYSRTWTGTELIIFGGYSQQSGSYLNTGARYNPISNSWTPMAGANLARGYHSAVWTGTELIVWGGTGNILNRMNSGSRYNPQSNTWTDMDTNNAPASRIMGEAIWTGNRVLIYAGSTDTGPNRSGGQYDPVADLWQPISPIGAPLADIFAAAIWTGSEMIVLNGDTGGRYNPTNDSWIPIDSPSPYQYRAHLTTGEDGPYVFWTDAGVLAFGGSAYPHGLYNPSQQRILYLYQKQ